MSLNWRQSAGPFVNSYPFEGEACPVKHRQHDSVLLCQQTGGSQVFRPFSEGGVPADILPETFDHSESEVRSGEIQHPGGRSQQSSHGPPLRMDLRCQSPPANLETVAGSNSRFIRHEVLSAPTDVRLSSPRPRSLGH